MVMNINLLWSQQQLFCSEKTPSDRPDFSCSQPDFAVHFFTQPKETHQWLSLAELPPQSQDFERKLCSAVGLLWRCFHPASALPALFPEPQLQDEVIFFGGSFDPWHAGHQACVNLCPHPEKLILLPDQNPQKQTSRSHPWQSYLHIQKQVASLPCSVYPGFLGLKHSNPTVTWLKTFKQRNKQLKTSFLMGDDSFLGLSTWVQAAELLSLVDDFYVVSRSHKPDQVHQFAKKHQLPFHLLGPHLYQDLASSKLRRS